MVHTSLDQVEVSVPPVVSLDPPRERRVSLVVIGALVIVVAALIAAWLVASAGVTHRVLVAGVDIPAGHVIAESDLRVAELGGELDVASVSAEQQSLVVGRAAASAIPTGTLINAEMLMAPGELVPAGHVVVGAVLRDGQVPVADLSTGMVVNLISTLDSADSGEGRLIGEGTIAQIQASDDGGHWVAILVDQRLELAIASAAAEQELRLGVVSG